MRYWVHGLSKGVRSLQQLKPYFSPNEVGLIQTLSNSCAASANRLARRHYRGELIVLNGNPYEFDFQTYARWRPSLFQSLRRWLSCLREERRRQREIRSLNDLSDWLLNDIGLTRWELLRNDEEKTELTAFGLPKPRPDRCY